MMRCGHNCAGFPGFLRKDLKTAAPPCFLKALSGLFRKCRNILMPKH